MKPRVLALDFDGTIAMNDKIDVDVADAITAARDAGLLAVLVTGRILGDLDHRLCGTPPFDAIVAENGAVLRLPGLASPVLFSEKPARRFVAELERHKIRHDSGLCVVEADADAAPQIVQSSAGCVCRLGSHSIVAGPLRVGHIAEEISRRSATDDTCPPSAKGRGNARVPRPGIRLHADGQPTGERARTVRDLLRILPALPESVVQRHLARGDFRRWIEDVFGDHELGAAIRPLEQTDASTAHRALLRAIAQRYGAARESNDRRATF